MNGHELLVLSLKPNLWGCHKRKKINGSQELTPKPGGAWLWGRAGEQRERWPMPQMRDDTGGAICWLCSFVTRMHAHTHTHTLPWVDHFILSPPKQQLS